VNISEPISNNSFLFIEKILKCFAEQIKDKCDVFIFCVNFATLVMSRKLIISSLRVLVAWMAAFVVTLMVISMASQHIVAAVVMVSWWLLLQHMLLS
jgi:hypothetical protein